MTVECVGGPLDGRRYEFNNPKRWIRFPKMAPWETSHPDKPAVLPEITYVEYERTDERPGDDVVRYRFRP